MFFSDAKKLSAAIRESSPEYIALKSCIERAVRYLDQDDLDNAKMSFLSDIRKCRELDSISQHPGTFAVIMHSNSKEELIQNMEGFSVVMSSYTEPEPEASGGSRPGI